MSSPKSASVSMAMQVSMMRSICVDLQPSTGTFNEFVAQFGIAHAILRIAARKVDALL